MPSSWVLRLRRPSGIPLRATMAKLLMRALLTTHLPLHPRRNRHIRAHTQKHMHCLHTHISVQPLWTAQESCKAKQAHTHTSPGRIHRWASWRAIACTHIDTHRHTDTQTRTDAHRHTGAQTHSHTQAHRHTDRHTDTSMHICMETRTKSCTDTGKRVHLGVHTYTRMHALACARAHALAHTHTHIHTERRSSHLLRATRPASSDSTASGSTRRSACSLSSGACGAATAAAAAARSEARCKGAEALHRLKLDDASQRKGKLDKDEREQLSKDVSAKENWTKES